MSQIVFLPGFDGEARLRRDFVGALAARHEVRAVTYPNRALGSLDGYRVHAAGEAPVDWLPVLVAESFSGLVAARWASLDPRVQALVLCGAFSRNPLGYATELGAAWPALVKMGPAIMNPAAQLSAEPARRRWSSGFARTVGALRNDVVAERLRLIATEDVGPALGALRIPVVVVQFEDDLVIGAAARAQLQAACARPHVVRLPGPHFALETRAAECAAAVDRALAAVLPRAA